MWKYDNDNTFPIITAQKHIESRHGYRKQDLPKTSILFYMHSGEEYTRSHYDTKLISEKFPRFLNSCPIYGFANYDVCFLDGGRGAPQAADTLETLSALGVKNVISVGMFGVFANGIETGDIIIPSKAFVEECTSLHYYSDIKFSSPDKILYETAISFFNDVKSLPVVSTDAVYRQTFFKENLWRKQGAVGVDMETSALFSIGKYLKMNVVSILIASDKHPVHERDNQWKWSMSKEARFNFFDKCIKFAFQI